MAACKCMAVFACQIGTSLGVTVFQPVLVLLACVLCLVLAVRSDRLQECTTAVSIKSTAVLACFAKWDTAASAELVCGA